MRYGPKIGGTYRERALTRWHPCPDWVLVLAEEADKESSLSHLSARVGIPPSTISAVIGNRYPARLDSVEARVRGVFMALAVHCPAIGAPIPRDRCMHFQGLRRQPLRGSGSLQVKLYLTCPTCPNAVNGGRK